MTTQTESMTAAFEQAMESFKKTSEAVLNMQQEAIQQWTGMWPTAMAEQANPLKQFQEIQKRCGNTMTDLLKRHREVVDKQYDEAVAALEEAVRMGESHSPDEFRTRLEQLCRRSLELMRHASEAQLKEFQEALAKWSETVSSATS